MQSVDEMIYPPFQDFSFRAVVPPYFSCLTRPLALERLGLKLVHEDAGVQSSQDLCLTSGFFLRSLQSLALF